MKITEVECLVASRTTADAPNAGNSIFIVTHTDEGLKGIGEAYGVGPDLATKEWVGYFAEQIVGHDPTRIEYLWAMMYQGARFPPGSSGMAALSGIDQSLWDITARSYNLPVYDLLGGRYRDRIRGYLDVNVGDSAGAGLDALRDAVRNAVDTFGYTAFKTSPLPADWRDLPWLKAVDSGVELIGALREAAGPDAEIGLDAHAAVFEAGRLLELADALSVHSPMFMEEPLRMENRHAMGELRKKMPFALATGECLYTKFELRELMRAGAADIIQPEMCIVGGMTEMRKIAADAEAHDVTIAPHNPMGPVATAVNLHFDVATPNFLIQEMRPFSEIELSFVESAPVVSDGHHDIPASPGWGIDLNLDAIAERPYQSNWHRGDRLLSDGAIAYI
ncbi:MAG: mandelate racemase/muconate lactonizing enzyme family protein [Chloroflexi bacterium]|nr:mandelate racemase/muconate lactonizing enzyme family protein [Chloroflexota bacterium]